MDTSLRGILSFGIEDTQVARKKQAATRMVVCTGEQLESKMNSPLELMSWATACAGDKRTLPFSTLNIILALSRRPKIWSTFHSATFDMSHFEMLVDKRVCKKEHRKILCRVLCRTGKDTEAVGPAVQVAEGFYRLKLNR